MPDSPSAPHPVRSTVNCVVALPLQQSSGLLAALVVSMEEPSREELTRSPPVIRPPTNKVRRSQGVPKVVRRFTARGIGLLGDFLQQRLN